MKKVIYTMCSEGDRDYFSILRPGNSIKLFENNDLKYEIELSDETPISSIVYKNNMIVYTEADKDLLFVHNVETDTVVSEYDFTKYDRIYVLKYVNDTEKVVLKAYKERQSFFVLFDLIEGKTICELEMRGEFYDFSMLQDDSYVLLCSCDRDVSVYAEDGDTLTTQLLQFRCNESAIEEIRRLMVYSEYDSFDDVYRSFVKATGGARFPLFDFFMYYWPVEKSLTASGKYAVYYQEDVKGLIISEVAAGDVYKILTLPAAYKKEDTYYYNDETGVLSILVEDEVIQYLITELDANYIERLNNMYNKAYKEKRSLQKNFHFKRVLFVNIENNICERREQL